MVKGLDIIKEQFSSYSDQYMLIGDAAYDILMKEAALNFRKTRTLDIVLCGETLSPDFLNIVLNFIDNGKYLRGYTDINKPYYYQLSKPENSNYPYIIELFTKDIKSFYSDLKMESPKTLGTTETGFSSFSEIFMDDEYYSFIKSGKIVIDGLSVLNAANHIPVIARAHNYLKECLLEKKIIDKRKTDTYKNDVRRLSRLLKPESTVSVPHAAANDINHFIFYREFDCSIYNNLHWYDKSINTNDEDDLIKKLRNYYLLDMTRYLSNDSDSFALNELALT